MNAAALKREIEMVLGITGAQAVNFWRIAAAAAPAGAAAYDPQFSGGVFVATPGASAGQQAARHLMAGHKFTLDRHFDTDLTRCVLAAADGDAAAARVQAIWASLSAGSTQMLSIERLKIASRPQ